MPLDGDEDSWIHDPGPGRAVQLADVARYLTELRDETWKRQDSAMSQETIVEEVRELLIARHPDWGGQEWIEPGVGCLCAEHAA